MDSRISAMHRSVEESDICGRRVTGCLACRMCLFVQAHCVKIRTCTVVSSNRRGVETCPLGQSKVHGRKSKCLKDVMLRKVFRTQAVIKHFFVGLWYGGCQRFAKNGTAWRITHGEDNQASRTLRASYLIIGGYGKTVGSTKTEH